MFVVVAQFFGHLGDEGGKECADSCIVLLEEFLACGGGLLDGAHCGIGGLFYGLDCGLCDNVVGYRCVAEQWQPGEKGGACNAVLPGYG